MLGVFDYRGALLPLIDSGRLLDYDACDVRMSSRILVVRGCEEATDRPWHCGLLVEHVLGTEQLEFDDETDDSRAHSSGLAFLGPVIHTATGIVQLMVPSRLPKAGLLVR